MHWRTWILQDEKIYRLQFQDLFNDTLQLPFPTCMWDFITVKAHEKLGLKGLIFFSLFVVVGKVSYDIWEGKRNTVAEDLIFIGFYSNILLAKCDKCGINGRKCGCFWAMRRKLSFPTTKKSKTCLFGLGVPRQGENYIDMVDIL